MLLSEAFNNKLHIEKLTKKEFGLFLSEYESKIIYSIDKWLDDYDTTSDDKYKSIKRSYDVLLCLKYLHIAFNNGAIGINSLERNRQSIYGFLWKQGHILKIYILQDIYETERTNRIT